MILSKKDSLITVFRESERRRFRKDMPNGDFLGNMQRRFFIRCRHDIESLACQNFSELAKFLCIVVYYEYMFVHVFKCVIARSPASGGTTKQSDDSLSEFFWKLECFVPGGTRNDIYNRGKVHACSARKLRIGEITLQLQKVSVNMKGLSQLCDA